MVHALPYFDGQTLAYTDNGDPAGFPILIQHGMVASISDTPLFHRLSEAGARLISIARPGYGASSPYEMRTVGEWGEIVGVLVDALGLSRFDVFGISSGAPYAYAAAHAMPDRARAVYILSGIPALYDDGVAACWPYPVNRQSGLAEMQALAYDLFFGHLSAQEREQADIRDSMANACFGPGLDLKIRAQDWGFTLGEVRTPVFMRHSRTDNFAAAEQTAHLLPDCHFEAREADEHFSQRVLDDFIQTVIVERMN